MLISFLTSELVQLSSEAKKKHENIKSLADSLVLWLKEKDENEIAKDLLNYNASISPLSASMESKNPKLIMISLNIYLKLISHKAISKGNSETLIKYLIDLKDSDKDIQLKILQLVLPLVTYNQEIHDSMLIDLIMLCYKLQETKAAVVNHTAEATFRQLLIFVFEKVEKAVDLSTIEAFKKDAVLIFQVITLKN
jgi:hypothetical protein